MKNSTMSVASAVSKSFGILGGIGGGIHGVGEIIQGNVRPDHYFIPSWTTGPIALYFDGDPAVTILPNMLAAGIATLIISILTILWAALFLKKKRDGLILSFLAIVLLLSGGGGGPPVLTLLAGIAGMGIGAGYSRWAGLFGEKTRNIIAEAWPYLFFICLANGIFLVIGHVVAAYFFAPVKGSIFFNSFLLSVPLLMISIFTGIYYDISGKGVEAT